MNTWHQKTAEYEADLYGVLEPSFLSKLFGLRVKNGEVEIKEYDTGERKMEVELQGLKFADGSTVSVVVDATPVCNLTLDRGFSRLVLSTSQGENVPKVHPGSIVEVRNLGGTLLQGVFRPD